MKQLTNKKQAQVDAFVDSIEEFDDLQRAWTNIKIMQQQKRLSTYEPCERDNCTLIDLRKGLIIGSGIDPITQGWLGRVDDYDLDD